MQQRWYDDVKYESIKKSIGFLKGLPDDILSIVAEGVTIVAEKQFKSSDLKAVGVDKIMALHKSKNKGRVEDKNKYLHKTVNYLAIMSESNRLRLGMHLEKLCTHTVDYFRICKQYDRAPEKEQVHAVVDTYVTKGEHHAQEFLNQIKQDFISNVTSKSLFIQSVNESADLRVGTRESSSSKQQTIR